MRYEEFAHNQRAAVGEEDQARMRLWAMVFTQGLRDFAEDMRGVTDCGAFPQEPSYWFWSHDNTTGSFVWLCDLFKVDPARARTQTLSAWRDLLIPRPATRGGGISRPRGPYKKN
jgi:hypothetical protein